MWNTPETHDCKPVRQLLQLIDRALVPAPRRDPQGYAVQPEVARRLIADEQLGADKVYPWTDLTEFVKRMDPSFEVIVGIAQPWADYLRHQEAGQSPFVFADNMLRTNLKLAALELEVGTGIVIELAAGIADEGGAGIGGNRRRQVMLLELLVQLHAVLGDGRLRQGVARDEQLVGIHG